MRSLAVMGSMFASKVIPLSAANGDHAILDALKYILGHDGVWLTTADEIAEYYIANHDNEVTDRIAKRQSGELVTAGLRAAAHAGG